jgi:putative protease
MKPELLLPVGNTEAFYAAVKGGADAVYLGLRKFNARGKATNFTTNQLQSLLKETERFKIKVYITLNTLIKNRELYDLLDTIYLLSQTKSSAIIIQDWGVYYLIKKYFPKILIHASTQMGNHNSLGVTYSGTKGFERIILARELTLKELQTINKKTEIGLELFTHGALCYSFSGMCLFSSFLGGMSANRGLCCQPCRRIYKVTDKSEFFFSLKDLQLIDLLPEIKKLNISALKVEGRMKSAEYVYQVARAYRMLIDDPNNIKLAKEILNYDMGREKTQYFLGKNVSEAITENPFIGIHIGKIISSEKSSFTFKTLHPLKFRDRLRILPKNGRNATALKINKMSVNGINKQNVDINEIVTIITDKIDANKNDRVFLIGLAENKFKNKFSFQGKNLKIHLPQEKKNNILSKIGSKKILNYEQLFIRISSLNWIKKLHFDSFDMLILNFSKSDWQDFNCKSFLIRKNIDKIIIELPKFIAENDIKFYQELCNYFYRCNVVNFTISHLSQKLILPHDKDIKIYTNENVYILNDAAIQFLKEENIISYVYPLENDFKNLVEGKDRKGIVPLYFSPELFYSRMPVKIKENDIITEKNIQFKKILRDGITIIIPEIPVSLLQHRKKLIKNGFRRFLIDFSYLNPSQRTFNRVLKNYTFSSTGQRGVLFNFKMGLK